MATTIKMPQLGESVTEGTIERWLVKEGDKVEQYDPLFEVVTDKVNAEVPAEVAGVVTKILVPDGETVKVGTPLAEIDAGDGNGTEPAASTEPAPAEAASAPAQAAPARRISRALLFLSLAASRHPRHRLRCVWPAQDQRTPLSSGRRTGDAVGEATVATETDKGKMASVSFLVPDVPVVPTYPTY